MKATTSSSVVVDRGELAAIALLTERPELLRADGRLGLMHIGVDLDGGIARLAERGIIRSDDDHRVNPHRPLSQPVADLLRTIDGATRHLHAIFDGGTIRYSHSLYVDEDTAVLLETADTVAARSFRLTRLGSGEGILELLDRMGLDGTGKEKFSKECEFSLDAAQIARLNEALERGDLESVRIEFETAGLSNKVATRLASGLALGRRAVEFHTSRRCGGEVRLGQIFWNVFGDGAVWVFSPHAADRSVSLSRSTLSLVTHEVSRLVERCLS